MSDGIARPEAATASRGALKAVIVFDGEFQGRVIFDTASEMAAYRCGFAKAVELFEDYAWVVAGVYTRESLPGLRATNCSDARNAADLIEKHLPPLEGGAA